MKRQPKTQRTPQYPLAYPMALRATMAAVVIAGGSPAWSAEDGPASSLKQMSIEELMHIKVTSVSKKEEPLSRSAAAVSVITGEEVLRSGALNLPEALRLAPGVQVAKVDAAQAAVSVRGFNDTFSQKLLVLMDGRSIYTPLFSGTIWQVQDILLEDLSRIEVIRGPGATVWGANAVNGVINIVSKPARETQGLLLTGGGGTQPTGMAGVRYGGQYGENTFFRIYGKFDDWRDSRLVSGGDAYDAWIKGQGGFRVDYEPSSANRLTFQGDMFGFQQDHSAPQVILPAFMTPPPVTGYNGVRLAHWNQTGGNLLGRWTRDFSEDSSLGVQVYYDHSLIDMALLKEKRDTFDIDIHHKHPISEWSEVVWGGGYRVTAATMTDGVEVDMNRTHRSDQIFNGFVQDEFKFAGDRLHLTLGAKVEHNDYTGFEVEPGARLSWSPGSKQTFWASVARAVRTPSQFEHDASVHLAVLPANPPFSPLPTVVSVTGNPGFESEDLLAWELGYRVQPHEQLTLDAALFLNEYDDLRGTDTVIDMSHAPSYVEAKNFFYNRARGKTYGGELGLTWQVADWWQCRGQLSLLQPDLEEPPNTLTGAPKNPNMSAPQYATSLRSSMNLGSQVDLDLWLRYADGFESTGGSMSGIGALGGNIPSYVTFDARLAWHPKRNCELAVVGQNLAGAHREFNPTFVSTSVTEVSRTVYAKLTLRF